MQDFDLIETPENVELERKLAGIGSRFIAGLIDNLVITGIALLLILAFVLLALAGFLASDRITSAAGEWLWAILTLAGYALYWGYFVFFEMRTNGQSPGKKALKIRVVKDGGGAITFTDIAIRNLLRVVDGQAAYAIAGICMFATSKAQRLGDLAAGTVVVVEGAGDYAAHADTRRAGLVRDHEATPEALRATGLSPEEYRVLMSYWTRRHQLSLEARGRLLQKLVAPILHRHGVAPPNESVQTIEYYLNLLIGKAMTASREGAATGPSVGPGDDAPAMPESREQTP